MKKLARFKQEVAIMKAKKREESDRQRCFVLTGRFP